MRWSTRSCESCLVALAQDDDAHGAVGVGGVLGESVELVDDRFCFWPVDQLVSASFAVALGHVDHFQRGEPVQAVLAQQDELVVGVELHRGPLDDLGHAAEVLGEADHLGEPG